MLFKKLMLSLANQKALTEYISKKGMSLGFAKRFVAGETIGDAIRAVVELNSKNINSILDYLGENVSDKEKAEEALDNYLDALDRVKEYKIDSTISVKLTQLGLDIDEKLCRVLTEKIAAQAQVYGTMMEIDMEDSTYTDRTIDLFAKLHKKYENVRLCIQAYLYRSERDIKEFNRLGAKVRLCKGAYSEPKEVAFQKKEDVDENYKHLVGLLLEQGTYPAFATHDENMIAFAQSSAEDWGIRKSEYEFQMLYGVRRDLQEELNKYGHNVRVYVPYGKEWCPYFMRRLAERPANTWFVIRNLIRE